MLDRHVDAARRTLGEVAATQGGPLEEAAGLVTDSVGAGSDPATPVGLGRGPAGGGELS
jgi:hypothetical protein